jgi:2-hydroxychromene-2-carboxylate isomerase
VSAAVTVRTYTDPGCPLAFAAEDVRLRLAGRYGEQVAWEPRMSVLRERRGDPWPAPAADATVYACLAVVAVGRRWPDRRDAFMRRLRELARAGEMLDDSDTLEIAAADAGLPVAELAAYCAEPEVAAALRAEADGAPPSPAWEIVSVDGTVELRGLPAIETADAALAALLDPKN